METRYCHQLEAMGEQLQKVTDEAKRQRETLAKTEDILHQQRQQMTAQLQEKEAELASAFQQNQKLQVHIIHNMIRIMSNIMHKFMYV